MVLFLLVAELLSPSVPSGTASQKPRSFCLADAQEMQGEFGKQTTLHEQTEIMHKEVEISTHLTIVLSLVSLPLLKWPGNLLKDERSLLFWSLLKISLSATVEYSCKTYSFETFY